MTKKKMEKGQVNSLAKDLVKTLNTKFKTNLDKAAFFLSDPDVASDVRDWISTGSDMLDLAISNRPNGGWPQGRIVEITGMEASGKSLLACYALKSTQEKGGLAIYIDTEAATSREYLQAIGVDIDKLVYLQLEALEDIFEAIEATIEKVRQSDREIPVTIVVDSVMGATTKIEQAAEYDKDGYATSKAIILSKAMRKITTMIARQKVLLVFTNQLRVRMGVTFGDKFGTSGGKAIPFHSSVRLRLKSMGKIKVMANGVDHVVGIKTRAIIQKNRLGPPLKEVDYDIYFDSGIDNLGSWLQILQRHKLAKSGTYWTLNLEYDSYKEVDKDGKPITRKFEGEIVDPNTGEIMSDSRLKDGMKFRSKDFGKFVEANPELEKWLYEAICDREIMEYKVNEDFGIDDIKIDTEDVSEES